MPYSWPWFCTHLPSPIKIRWKVIDYDPFLQRLLCMLFLSLFLPLKGRWGEGQEPTGVDWPCSTKFYQCAWHIALDGPVL